MTTIVIEPVQVAPGTVRQMEEAFDLSDLTVDVGQFQDMVRLFNRSGRCITGIEYRQYLPLSDNIQEREWLEFVDTDPAVSDIEVDAFRSMGVSHDYVTWKIDSLQPGAVVQFGSIAGIVHRSRVVGTGLPWRHHQFTPPPVSLLGENVLGEMLSTSYLDPRSSDFDQARSTTAAIPWDDLDAVLAARLASSAVGSDSTFWLGETRARRLAMFINTILEQADYPGTDEDGGIQEGTGFQGWNVPGGADWGPLVAQRADAVFQVALATIFLMIGQNPVSEITREWIAQTSQAIVSGPNYYTCSCSENSFLLLWFLRSAGVPCRELGGSLSPQRVGNAWQRYMTTGHRIVEVWDSEAGEWFVVDSTRPFIAPNLWPKGRMQTVWFRGRTGPDAPLGWSYRGLVTRLDGVDLIERDTSLPEGAAEFAALRDAIQVRTRAWGDDVTTRPFHFGLANQQMPESQVRALRGAVAARTRAGTALQLDSPTVGQMVAAGIDVHPPQCRPLAMALFAVMAPHWVVDQDFWFVSDFLLSGPSGPSPSCTSNLAWLTLGDYLLFWSSSPARDAVSPSSPERDAAWLAATFGTPVSVLRNRVVRALEDLTQEPWRFTDRGLVFAGSNLPASLILDGSTRLSVRLSTLRLEP